MKKNSAKKSQTKKKEKSKDKPIITSEEIDTKVPIPEPEPASLVSRPKEKNDSQENDENQIKLEEILKDADKSSKYDFNLHKHLKENIDFVRSFLVDKLPLVRLIEPEGTFLLWLDFSKLGLSDSEIDDIIVNKAKVWLDRGTMFGPEGECYQRINVATPRPVLEEALNRIAGAFKEIKHV